MCIIFVSSTCATQEQVTIPKKLSKEYKLEMERIINTEVPKAKKDVDKTVQKSEKLYKKLT